MSLRTTLLTGYLAFVTALATLGGWSAWRLHDMAAVSGRIISENYQSVVAAQDMKESLERQDSAALFELLGHHARAVPQVAEHRRRFDDAFARAANNITEVGEADLIAAIRDGHDDYYRRFDAFMRDSARSANVSPPAALSPRLDDEYFSVLQPLFDRVRGDCDRLLRLNQQAMVRKSDAAVAAARRWFAWTTALSLVMIVAGVGLAVVLARRILEPIGRLTTASQSMAQGDLTVEVPAGAPDEIGALASAFNTMAGRIRELRATDLGQLMIAQQTTEAAIDSLYDPVLVTDSAGKLTRVNAAAERLFGPRAGNIGRPIGEIARDSRIAAAVAEVLASERTVAAEGTAATLPLAVQGVERAYRLRSTPMRDVEGRMVGAVTLLEDVTHLREIDRIKSEFIAAASHELRTPLTTVQMGLHLLLEPASGPLTGHQREILAACRDDAGRLERLTRELLDLSKIESGESPPRLADVDLLALVRETADRMRPQAEPKGVTLALETDSPVKPATADRVQIERVLTNLLTNAIRATDRGGRIVVGVADQGGLLRVSVSDTGRGIPADYLARIFDPFVQAPNVPPGGAGLGLTISRRIVEAHGGQIAVHSQVGRGTAVTFTLPVAPAETEARSHVAADSDRRR